MNFKKVFKWIGITVAVLFVLIAGLIAQSMFRFDIHIHPVSFKISKNLGTWGTMVPITPDIYDIGESFSSVKKKLNFAGYKLLPVEDVWKRYEDKAGENKYVFTREASFFPGNARLYVFIETDAEGVLLLAEGTKHEHGCL